MLVGNSIPEYVFIRSVILGLRSIAVLSVFYTLITLVGLINLQHHSDSSHGAWPYRLLLPVEIYLLIEAAFFTLVYLPLWILLQSAANHPEAPPKEQRRALFEKVLQNMLNADRYISGWFLETPMKTIQRENVKEFIAWSLMNEHAAKLNTEQSDEIDEYIEELEEKCDHEFRTDGHTTPSLRTTFDHVPMQHRPLIWYLAVFLVDLISHLRLLFNGLIYYRSSWLSTLSTFPPRPLTLFGRSQKIAGRLSYWYRPHKSKNELPIIFIHGIGVGLYTYVDFIAQMMDSHPDNHQDIGIIVIEILPISSRICAPALTTHEMKSQIQQILGFHSWNHFVLVGHSYGTAIAATILRDPILSKRVKGAMLMDPICFLLHLPDVAYNFTRRRPIRANERMLNYFSSTDMLISHTLARRFFWSEYILWKEDINLGTNTIVVLSAKDLIVPTAHIWTYLTGSEVVESVSRQAKIIKGRFDWKEGKLKVIWFNDFDHAGLFSSRKARRAVASDVIKLCKANESVDE